MKWGYERKRSGHCKHSQARDRMNVYDQYERAVEVSVLDYTALLLTEADTNSQRINIQ